MIERLLEFSRMCNIKPNVEPLDIKKMIEDIFAELLSLNSHRSIQLECDDLPTVMGDKLLITNVLKNIVNNCVKFTKNREQARIFVKSQIRDGFVEIAISDNGAGFDMKYSDKLFGIFQRLHFDDEFEGSGVGLALIDRIMKRHGGKVSIVGEVDRGTTITLYFDNSSRE